MDDDVTKDDLGFYTARDLHTDRKVNPPVRGIFPFSHSVLYEAIRQGRLPKPIYPFGPRLPLWPKRAIHRCIAELEQTQGIGARVQARSHDNDKPKGKTKARRKRKPRASDTGDATTAA
jgi:hypothetical protein